MNSIRIAIFFSALAALHSGSVSADILMFDFNLSFKEEQTAVAAAAQKVPPEKVVVIPQIPEERRAEFSAIRDQIEEKKETIEALGDKIQKKIATKAEIDASEKLGSEVRALQVSISAKVKPFLPKVGGKDGSLSEIFHQAVVQGNFSGLIVSGHSGNGNFFGNIGTISRKEFDQMYEDPRYKEKAAAIGELFLWGCFTSTIRETLIHLRNFPGAGFIAGFSGRAPTENRQGNLDYLKASILRADQIAAAYQNGDKGSLAKVAELVRSIPSFSAMNAAVTVCGNAYVSNDKGAPLTIGEIRSLCEATDGKNHIDTLQSEYCGRIQRYMLPLKKSESLAKSERESDCICNLAIDCPTDSPGKNPPPPGRPPGNPSGPKSDGSHAIALKGTSDGAEESLQYQIDPAFASVPAATDTSEITLFYTNLYKYSHCSGKFMERLFKKHPDIIQNILYLRFFNKLYSNWFAKYGSTIPPGVGLKPQMTRGEVLLALNNYMQSNMKTEKPSPAVLEAMTALRDLREDSEQLNPKMIE